MKHLLFAFLLFSGYALSAQNCGTSIFTDEFNTDGSLPSEWTEENTVGQVTVEGGRLKFDLTADQPSAYRTFTPVTENVTVHFTEQSSRNYVKCRFDVLSSTGKYLTSIMFGNNGAGTVQYATALDASSLPTTYTGALIDHTYKKNYEYAFSIALDFSTNTFDFYADGVIGGQDIPFMAPSTDVAKVSITQISMYADNGQFYFDNIGLSNPGADRSVLSSGIASATSLTESGIISPLYGFSPETYQAIKIAGTEANLILQNCEASQAEIDEAATTLQTAITTYENSFVDEVVLKAYDGYDYSGKEYGIHCGYYNGGLDTLDDKIVSFKLEKGYMATFAQDVNGLGVSKVYVAQDEALELNLPEALQHSISFIRVSPWYSVGKKGSIGKIKWSAEDKYNTEWYYTWGMGKPLVTEGNCTPEVQFVPMSWSKGDSFSGLVSTTTVGENMSYNHHLAFNEPDNAGQSNLTVAQALAAYPQLLASGLRLGAPGVENVNYSAKNSVFNDGAWIAEFMDSCVARGYRVDFIPAHDYVRRSTSDYLKRFKALSERYNIPVWVTEYNYGNPNMGSAELPIETGYAKIKAMTEAFEEADYIERYNWYYFFGASSGIGGITNDTLNMTGKFYRDLASPAPSYIQEKYEDGPYIETAINELQNQQSQITVSPNPVTGDVFVITDAEGSLLSGAVVSLYDIHGVEVLKIPYASQFINVSHLGNGFYVVKISSQNRVVTTKIVINR